MDYRKEHNGWVTFFEHWSFLLIILLLIALTPLFFFLFRNFGSPKRAVISESDDISGDMSTDTNSVFWCVLSRPGTNQLEFVFLLPVTTTIGSGGESHPTYSHDYCNLQVKSSGHQWKIDDDLDWKSGIHTVQFQDLTANTTEELKLDNGPFWQLDEQGHATRLDTVDSNTLAQIFAQVKTNETKIATGQAEAGD